MHADLPVEVINVLGVVDKWKPEQNVESEIGIILDGLFTELASLKGLANLSSDCAGRQGMHGIDGQIAKISGIPKRKLRSRAVLYVLTHLVGSAQTSHEDLADQVFIGYGASGSRDTHSSRSNDDLEVGVFSE